MEKRLKREGMYVYLKLTHVIVRQKPTQHCKAIILQFKEKSSTRKKMSPHPKPWCRELEGGRVGQLSTPAQSFQNIIVLSQERYHGS